MGINVFAQPDRRIGSRGVVPVQENQAANGIQLTQRPSQDTSVLGGAQPTFGGAVPGNSGGPSSFGQVPPWAQGMFQQPQQGGGGIWGGPPQGGGMNLGTAQNSAYNQMLSNFQNIPGQGGPISQAAASDPAYANYLFMHGNGGSYGAPTGAPMDYNTWQQQQGGGMGGPQQGGGNGPVDPGILGGMGSVEQNLRQYEQRMNSDPAFAQDPANQAHYQSLISQYQQQMGIPVNKPTPDGATLQNGGGTGNMLTMTGQGGAPPQVAGGMAGQMPQAGGNNVGSVPMGPNQPNIFNTGNYMNYDEFVASGRPGSDYSNYLTSATMYPQAANSANLYDQIGGAAGNMLNGTNIDVVGGPPQNPGRFDQFLNNYWGQPDVYNQVGSQMGNFNPNINPADAGPAPAGSAGLPGRDTPYFNNFQNTPGVATQPGINPVTTPGRENADVTINQTAAGNQATQGALSSAAALQQAGQQGASINVDELLKPFSESAARNASEATERGQGYLARIGGGRNVGAQTDLARKVSRDATGEVQKESSRITGQAMSLAPSMLNAQTSALTGASSAYGNIAGTQANLASQQANLNLGANAQNVQQRQQDISTSLQNNVNQLTARGQDISVLSANADRLSQEMLGMAGMDIQKYMGDRGLDIEAMQMDITKHFQERGMNLADAQFATSQYFDALNATMGMQGQQGQQQAQMAQLAQAADQGDTNAAMQHAGLMLDQAVASGQLTAQQQQMALNSLMNLWSQPQQFMLQYQQMKNQFQMQERMRQDQLGDGSFFGGVNAGTLIGAGAGVAAAAAGKG